jgi:hypothetical protein
MHAHRSINDESERMLASERDSAIGKVADKSEQTPLCRYRPTHSGSSRIDLDASKRLLVAYSSEDAGTADGKRSRRQRDVQKMEFAGR